MKVAVETSDEHWRPPASSSSSQKRRTLKKSRRGLSSVKVLRRERPAMTSGVSGKKGKASQRAIAERPLLCR